MNSLSTGIGIRPYRAAARSGPDVSSAASRYLPYGETPPRSSPSLS